MMEPARPPDFRRLKVLPLAARRSLTTADDILLSPDEEPPQVPTELEDAIASCAAAIKAARKRGAAVLLFYGAHLLRNGAAAILERLMENKWLTHLATNGAGTIHDWEYAWLGASTESVRENVATGTFGIWDETSTNIHVALMAGALDGLGYGQALGRFIAEDGAMLPPADELRALIAESPEHPLTAARADLLRCVNENQIQSGRVLVNHPFKRASILHAAWKHNVPLTVHPGIGYDIIANHPIFSGSVIGRAAELDFKLIAGSIDRLDGGVVISVGSAIMAPQVFEKALSCVNNVRLQSGRGIVQGHSIHVVDLQDGGGWDWTCGEPPKTNPAYYLRFCKSFSRMGAPMHYLQCDNACFIQHLWRALR
ncbi:MAG: hypothetical protein ACO1QR_13305 [Chthoniobacteraceae bacterium]